MSDTCKHLKAIYSAPYHGDVFDHPTYKHICLLKNKEIFYCNIICNKNRCKNFDNKGSKHD